MRFRSTKPESHAENILKIVVLGSDLMWCNSLNLSERCILKHLFHVSNFPAFRSSLFQKRLGPLQDLNAPVCVVLRGLLLNLRARYVCGNKPNIGLVSSETACTISSLLILADSKAKAA